MNTGEECGISLNNWLWGWKNEFWRRYLVFYSGTVVTEFFSSVFVQIWSDLGKQSEFKKQRLRIYWSFPRKEFSNKIKHLQRSQIKRKVRRLQTSTFLMVRQAGFEPTTPWFVARYSIQLSYWRTSDFSFVSVALRGEECVFYERKRKMQVFF